jgi:hypothetical protein
MATTTNAAADGLPALPAAGRLPEGGVRFYGWAPDPERPGTHRLSVHERDPRTGRRTDRDLDFRFGSHEEAEAVVARLNGAAPPTAAVLDRIADAHDAEANRLKGQAAGWQRECARLARERAARIRGGGR